MNMVSYASRPSRIYIRSDDAIDRAGTGTPSNFVLPLIENIIDCKAVQLLSMRIPNAMGQIPNYQRYFIYKITISGTPQYRAFMIDHNVDYSDRLYGNYTTLASRLTTDAAYWIPYNGTPLKHSDFMAATAQPADLSFTVDPATNKILCTAVGLSGSDTIQLGSETDFQTIIVPQEVVKNYLYLNFLLGYETRPLVLASLPPLNNSTNTTYTPPSWANLVYTQTIYVQTNMVMNGTYTSDGTRNILQTIPVTVPPLAIIAYQSSQRHYIRSVPDTIGTITIRLLDENGQPIYLPENAQVELEIGCLYEEDL